MRLFMTAQSIGDDIERQHGQIYDIPTTEANSLITAGQAIPAGPSMSGVVSAWEAIGFTVLPSGVQFPVSGWGLQLDGENFNVINTAGDVYHCSPMRLMHMSRQR